MSQHDHPDGGVRRGVAQPLMQLADEDGRQRVAVVGRIEVQARERASGLRRAGVFDQRVHH
jgi:hypothetical protein